MIDRWLQLAEEYEREKTDEMIVEEKTNNQ